MRIRKRQVPLAFSSLSPAPLPDPFIHRSPTVQLRQTTDPSPLNSPSLPDTATSGLFQPSVQTNHRRLMIGGGSNGCDGVYDASGGLTKEDNLRCSRREKEDDGKKSGRRVKRPDVGSCYKGEQASPPMKQRRDMARRENEESSSMEDKKMKTKMKRARGSALMAGSRCSRVNGRGWRCCQQTLVGYSLCEHHLGKGRLRSLTTQRSGELHQTRRKQKERERQKTRRSHR